MGAKHIIHLNRMFHGLDPARTCARRISRPNTPMRTMVLVYLPTSFWVIYGVNVGIHIPAPWSIWDIECTGWWVEICLVSTCFNHIWEDLQWSEFSDGLTRVTIFCENLKRPGVCSWDSSVILFVKIPHFFGQNDLSVGGKMAVCLQPFIPLCSLQSNNAYNDWCPQLYMSNSVIPYLLDLTYIIWEIYDRGQGITTYSHMHSVWYPIQPFKTKCNVIWIRTNSMIVL